METDIDRCGGLVARRAFLKGKRKARWRGRLTTMSEPLLEASLTAEGLLSITRPPGTGVEVGVGIGVCVGVGVAAEAVLAG